MNAPRNWLILGPGAVGQVLALALTRAGERPRLLGRRQPKPVARNAPPPPAGETPSPRPAPARAGPARFRDEDEGVPATLAAETFVTTFPDEPLRAIILAVRSDQLLGCLADWTDDIRRSGAPVVFLQPGFGDRALLEKTLPGIPLVQGNPGFLAYFEDDGELVYWTYRLLPTLFAPVRGEGMPALIRDLRHKLRLGRIPTRTSKDVGAEIAAVISWVMPFLAALEEVGFDFDELRDRPDLLDLAARAGDEAHRTAMATMPKAGLLPRLPGWIPPVVSANAAKLVLGMIDDRMRTMWEVHARKIREQTRLMIEDLIQRASERHDPTPHLIQLRDLVWAADERGG